MMTTPTKASERYDTNEINLLSEESCASSSDSDDCTAHSDAPRKRIKQDDFTSDTAATKSEALDNEAVNFDVDVTKPYFLTLGTGCASPSPLKNKK